VTHLHLPDGAVPWWLWVPGMVVAALLLWIVSRRHRKDRRDRLALVGALSALMLAAMALPLGPLGYHLSLAPVVGILLGGGLAYVASCVVNGILALLGHGGVTVIGLNALVTGIAAALSSRTYRIVSRRFRPFLAAGIASTVGMIGSLAAWLVVVGIASTTPNPAGAFGTEVWPHGGGLGISPGELAWHRLGRLAALSIPFWILGTLAEGLVAGGIVRFLARVHPSLLPGRATEPESSASVHRATPLEVPGEEQT
jgi:cobalt/nickel transport system permease protein